MDFLIFSFHLNTCYAFPDCLKWDDYISWWCFFTLLLKGFHDNNRDKGRFGWSKRKSEVNLFTIWKVIPKLNIGLSTRLCPSFIIFRINILMQKESHSFGHFSAFLKLIWIFWGQTSFGHLKESKSQTEAKGSRGGSCKETHGKYWNNLKAFLKVLAEKVWISDWRDRLDTSTWRIKKLSNCLLFCGRKTHICLIFLLSLQKN